MSAKRAIELTETIYAMDFMLPESKQRKTINLSLTDEQKAIYHISS